jgi:hypothetical protein
MSILTHIQNMNLMRSVYKRLQEDAEAERDRGSQDLYDRLQAIEYQKCLDQIDQLIHNGSNTPKARLEAVADLMFQLYPDLEDYDDDDDSDEVELGGVTAVDQRPST